MSDQNLIDKIRNAGVVGAGGAGFPTHIKLNYNIETLIINGAECEPLISKDKEIMKSFAPQIAVGLNAVREFLSPQNTIFGVKAKNKAEINALKGTLDTTVKYCLMKDVYPAGDEFVLVFEATGKLIPPGGIPPEIGCVVINVETLYNIGLASQDIPVTEKMITVAGAVKKPSTFKIPIGTSYSDCLKLAGGPSITRFAIISGGAMMGELVTDLSTPVIKTTSGLIVLPIDHQLIKRRSLTKKAVSRIGVSACDQCYRCTELCPRWLLGYEIIPHEVMRSLLFGADRREQYSIKSLNCIECNICSLFACPEDLDPKSICAWSKRELFSKGIRPDKTKIPKIHPMRQGRQVPTKLLTHRLGLNPYDISANYVELDFIPEKVFIPLKQHAGSKAIPVVKVGERVKKGMLIGDLSPDQLGAKIHSSIDGIVESVTNSITIKSL
jgi:Na+-translocating ferredoxin:NAD+ oxidoreductase RnfC subunit